MRVTCPKCQLRGSVDAELLTKKARITCAQCATIFDAIVSDGAVKTIPTPSPSYRLPRQISQPHKDANIMHIMPDSEDTSPNPQSSLDEAQGYNEASILELEPLPTTTDNVIEPFATDGSKQPTSTGFACLQEDILALPPVADAAALPVASDKKSVAFAGGARSSLSNFDRYDFGVQLLQVRPVWLLLSGLVFVSFIIFCSWFIRTDGEASGISSDVSTMNHSTNQSVATETLPSSIAESDADTSATQQSSLVTTGTETKDAPPVAETVEQAGTTTPTVEAVISAPVAVSNQPDGNDGGKFTVQVGSYNERAQADERVAGLQSSGFEARVVAAELPNRGTWYRVQIGRFASRDEATRYGAQLRARGVADNMIVTEMQAK